MEIKFKYKILLLSVTLSSMLNASLWFMIANKFPPSDIPYVIHYSVLSGADIFGTKNNLFVLPALGLIIITINTLVALLLRKKEVFLSYVFLSVSFIIQAILLVAIFGLLKFNGQI